MLLGPFIRSRTALVLGTAYLLFALIMTMAAGSTNCGAFNPNDRQNQPRARLLHFVVFAFSVVRLLFVGILMMTALAYYGLGRRTLA